MKRKTIWTLAKKEFFDYLNSASAYVIIIPFLILTTFFYFRTVFMTGEANLRPFFELLPWFLIFLAPALAMRCISQEKQRKTLELLISHPISEAELVAGKFLGSLLFYGLTLLATGILPLVLLIFGSFEPGVISSQYLGGFLVGAVFISLGITASSLVESTVASFLLGASLCFGLILVGSEWVLLALPAPISGFFGQLAILPHLKSLARGVIDLRDFLYFVSACFFFLTVAVFRLSGRKIEEKKKEKIRLYWRLGLILAIGVLLNLLMRIYPLRLDLTRGRQYSLTSATKKILSRLPDLVKIKIFTSRQLPGPIQPTLRNIEDLLRDYQKWSRMIKIEKVYPDSDSEAKNEADSWGIQEIAFNRIAAGKFEVQTGYLGLSLRFGDKTEVIPYIENTADLEYQLSRRIQKITAEKEKIIGVYGLRFYQDYQSLNEVLSSQYQVKNVNLNAEEKENFDLLLVLDNASQEASPAAQVSKYLDQGGRVIFLLDKIEINSQYGFANPVSTGWEKIMENFGLKLKEDLVYDLQLAEIIALGSGGMRYLSPYPFWFRALPADQNFTPLTNIESVILAWPSSIEIEEKPDLQITRILHTSSSGGRQEGSFTISPEQIKQLSEPAKEEIVLGVAVSDQKNNSRIVLIGDQDFIKDQFTQQSPENLSLVSNLVDWLIADEALASIPSRTSGKAVFHFTSRLEPILVQYLSLILPPVFVGIFGSFWLARRKRLFKKVYQLKKPRR